MLFRSAIDAVVRGDGTWTGYPADRTDRNNIGYVHSKLKSRESEKYGKHEAAYAARSYGFLALAISVFGALGPDAIRLLWALADVASRRDVPGRISTGDPAPLRAHHFASAATRISLLALQQGVVRLSGRNLHGPARQPQAPPAAPAAP